ncbi:MAG: exopolysaccharide biosynthesis protein [Bacillota bacterium]
MSKEFNNKSFSRELADLADSLPAEGLTLRELMERLRRRGLLMLCMVLTVPFLIPLSIPGSSTPFGLVIALLGLGVVADRPPWLPGRLVDRRLAAESLLPVLRKGALIFGRIEKWTHPRLPALTRGKAMGRVNGFLLVISAVMLTAPLPLPFSNTLPAYAVLFLAAGSLERDGYLVLAGYLMVALTAVYFGLLALLGAGLQVIHYW